MTPTGRLRRGRRHIVRRVFERGDLEDTYGVVALGDLAHPDRGHYEPSGWRCLARSLRGCRIAPDDVFLDYGSGKGRVVQLAARLPFARVLGIEISAELTAVARRNVDSNRERLRCRDVSFVCCDVVGFEVPDDVTYAYVFNSFGGATFSAAMEGLVRSHDRRPRALTVIYGHPLEAELLAAHPRFARERIVGRGRRLDRQLHIYTVLAAAHERIT